MSTFSKTILVGNLGQDPRTTHFENGGQITNFSVATTEHWKDKTSGEKKSLTEWHNVTVSGKQSELCEKYLKKGSKVLIEGKNKTRKYQDANNVERYITEVRAMNVTFMSSKQEGDNGSAVDQYQGKEPHAGDEFLASKDPNDDLPF